MNTELKQKLKRKMENLIIEHINILESDMEEDELLEIFDIEYEMSDDDDEYKNYIYNTMEDEIRDIYEQTKGEIIG